MAKAKKATEGTPGATGTPQDAPMGPAPVEDSPSASVGPPTLAEVQALLGDSVDEGLYRAERSAQASVCYLPGDDTEWPQDLRDALVLRCSVATKNGPRRGSADPEVRRLEETHQKRVPASARTHTREDTP